MWYILFLILWILFLVDSSGALVGHFSGNLQTWYATALPAIQGSFPVQNGWPFMYFVLALLGFISIVTCKPCKKEEP